MSPQPGPRATTTTAAGGATVGNNSGVASGAASGAVSGAVSGVVSGVASGGQSPWKKQLAGTLLGRGVVPCTLIKSKPRYEQFFECGTRLTLSATFHRQLQLPHDPPSALPLGKLPLVQPTLSQFSPPSQYNLTLDMTYTPSQYIFTLSIHPIHATLTAPT